MRSVRDIRYDLTSLAVFVCLLVLLGGCAGKLDIATEGVPEPTYVETGDLDRVAQYGVLRVLRPRLTPRGHLPRSGNPLDHDSELVELFAAQEGLALQWVYVDSRDHLLTALLEGEGDLVVANLTITDARREQVAFTVPVAHVREELVARLDDPITEPAQLAGRTIAVRRSSSYWETAQRLRQEFPKIGLFELSEQVETEGAIDLVARGEVDFTIADDNLLESALRYRDDVRGALTLTGDQPIAWALRPDAPLLLDRLNQFLNAVQFARRHRVLHVDDLPGLAERKVLRVLTRNAPSTYFLWRGQLMGFEYELARRFAKRHGMLVEVIVPPTNAELLQMLVRGEGDVVAAALTPTEERRRLGVAFSRPYNWASQVIVRRSDDELSRDFLDLAGRDLFVRRSSAYWTTLAAMQRHGHDLGFNLHPAPEQFDTEEIIDMVGVGTYDLTVADSHILDVELTWREDVDAAFPLGEPVPLTWAVRDSNPELLTEINNFFRREYRGEFYNVIYKKYFKDPKRIRRHLDESSWPEGDLSPYDPIVQPLADEYGFDWRLIVAQIYQESRFDAKALSFAGAIGPMQILPRTATQMGVVDVADVEQNILAGVRYMDWLRNRFDDNMPVRDRIWFTLAAYNAGYGHVADARQLAAHRGWNPDRWFGHVERAMLLLSRPEHAREARHGYVRGREPVDYVRRIRARFDAYVETLGS